jgi:hypothetical protein
MKIDLLKNLASRRPYFPEILIVSLIGLFLRLYQLGADSLWFDEIGVGLVI